MPRAARVDDLNERSGAKDGVGGCGTVEWVEGPWFVWKKLVVHLVTIVTGSVCFMWSVCG